MVTIGGLPIQDIVTFAVPYPLGTQKNRALLKYNKALEEQGHLIQLNESFLESKLEELESISSLSGTIEKFTLARLTELALLCVGNYPDNGCIGELGDLMFNPRLIHVHIKGKHVPVKKER